MEVELRGARLDVRHLPLAVEDGCGSGSLGGACASHPQLTGQCQAWGLAQGARWLVLTAGLLPLSSCCQPGGRVPLLLFDTRNAKSIADVIGTKVAVPLMGILTSDLKSAGRDTCRVWPLFTILGFFRTPYEKDDLASGLPSALAAAPAAGRSTGLWRLPRQVGNLLGLCTQSRDRQQGRTVQLIEPTLILSWRTDTVINALRNGASMASVRNRSV